MEEKSNIPLNKENVEPSKESKEDWWSQLKDELRINKKMIPVKLALCFCMAGFYSFFPYLTLHMQVIGIGIDKIAITYAILPFASFVGPIISGIIADKFGRYTVVLSMNIALTGLLHTLLLLVPHNRIDTMEFQCDSSNYYLSWKECSQDFARYNISDGILLKDCMYTCEEKNNSHFDICFSNMGEDFTSCTTRNKGDDEVIIRGIFSETNNQNCNFSLSKLHYDSTPFDSITCPNDCPLKCLVNNVDVNGVVTEVSSDVPFYIYLVCRVLGTVCLASSFAMLDAVVLAKVRETKSQFGKQRVVSLLGQAFSPLAAGALVDIFYTGGVVDYGPTLYFGDACLVIAIIILLTMDMTIEPAKENMVRNVGKLLSKIEIDIFLIIIIFLGTLWGFLETYLFLYLDDLKAPTYLLGLTLSVGCASGAPAMFFSDYIIKKIGRSTVFLLSFVAYFVRFLGYSYITSPWYCFPFELLEIITYQILWVAAATYFPILAPQGLLATMTGIGGAAHYSLGRGLGSFIGGFFIKWYGLKMTFRIFGYSALGGGVLHVLTHELILKKKIQTREKILKLVELQEENSDKLREQKEMMEIIKDTSRRNSFT